MKQTVEFPMRTKSENVYRRGHWAAHARRTAKQRAEVRIFLDSQLTKRPQWRRLGDALEATRFRVTLVRLSAGELDDDNLRGALKAIRDEVASWLGLDDRDAAVRFEYGQGPIARGHGAVRVTIEDDEAPHVETIRKVGNRGPIRSAQPTASAARRARGRGSRAAHGDVRGNGARARAPARAQNGAAADQRRLPFLRSFALLPWDQDGEGEVYTELEPLAGETPPPERITVPAPHTAREFRLQGREVAIRIQGGRLELERHRYRSAELGGDCWVYLPSA